MKRILSICFFLLTVIAAGAQPLLNEKKYVDSLTALEQRAANDSIKARAAFLLSDFWSYSDTAKALHYLQAGKQYSGSNRYLQAVHCFYEAGYFFDTDMDKALQLYAKSAELFAPFAQKESYVFQARAWRNSGALYQRKNDLKKMVDLILTKSVPLAQKAGDNVMLGGYYADVGMVFMNERLHAKAAFYLDKALAYYGKAKPPLHMELQALLFTTDNYVYWDSLPRAKIFLDRAGALLEPYPESEHNLDFSHSAAIYYRTAGNPARSVAYLERGIALAEKLNKRYKLAALRYQQYEAYFEQGKYEAARKTLQQAIDETPVSINGNLMLYFKSMSQTYEKMGNLPRAYDWLKKFNTVRDSVYPERLKSELTTIESKYNGAEKEKRIIQLQAEQRDALMKAKNQRLMNWLLGIAGLALLTITLLLVIFYRNSRRQARQKLTEMQQQQELQLANAIMEGEERERRRVARDLHDGLGGALSGIRIKLSGHQKEQPAPRLEEVIDQLEDSIGELRRIARNMMPESLLKSGLEAALRDLCESLMNEHTDIEFQAYGIQADMPTATQANIFRIVQELLSNAIRHAQASKIILQCIQNDRTFLITAEDNGRGFDTAAMSASKGIGLTNIQNRVQYMKGRFDIESAPNEGTIINIEVYV
ncbi:sensor histidine kinase [Chitinophaga lutea]|uniref:histidine kinase n=1 Tax=Chitinophaga lutea TaxID=2488634 RepID=A0A3N4Q8Q9_9BACT|nr:sensor histidine kinase [Chitinophaga lutea]RPE08104.1 sensor histidine kinase [Chitinophaga lutea]